MPKRIVDPPALIVSVCSIEVDFSLSSPFILPLIILMLNLGIEDVVHQLSASDLSEILSDCRRGTAPVKCVFLYIYTIVLLFYRFK